MDFIFDPSLVLYLPLYELDASFMSRDAYGHLGTVTGALWRPNGRWFDGGDDLIALPAAAFDTLTSCTVCMWYKPNINLDGQATHRTLFSFYKDATNWIQFYYSQSSGNFRFLEYVGGVVKADISTAGDRGESQEWHFLQCDFGVGGAEVWIDNDSFGTDTEEHCIANIAPTTANYIGTQTPSGQPWSGDIGEVWIYNRALNPLEIQRNYLTTKWRYR